MNKTVEILQYILYKNTGTRFHSIMQEISVPLHQRYGIDVVSFGNSLHDIDSYYLIRAFESAEAMDAMLDVFYSSSDWRNGPREEIISCIKKSIKVLIKLPSISVDGLRM
ncbi:TPA: NIPSNAP family protein [Enterobacter roggenkampii]